MILWKQAFRIFIFGFCGVFLTPGILVIAVLI